MQMGLLTLLGVTSCSSNAFAQFALISNPILMSDFLGTMLFLMKQP